MGLVVLVRHGQASFGGPDYDELSDVGHQQARLVGERLRARGAPVARLLCGELRRQRQTADGIADVLGGELRPEVDPRWDEYDAGDVLGQHQPAAATSGPTEDDPRRAFQAYLDGALARWTSGQHDTDYREPFSAFGARVAAALGDVLTGSGVTVVATSGGVIGAVCASLLGLPPSGWTALQRVTVNSALTTVVAGRSGTSLLTVNDHAHLEGRDPALLTYR